MAGTRLAVHATFVVELFVLVASALLYASTKSHDPFESADPFLADRSGWKILVEDVSPVPSPDDAGIIGQVEEHVTAAMHQVQSLMGMEVEKTMPDRPRRGSAFVHELREKVARFHVDQEGGGSPLKVTIRIPQVESSAARAFLVESLEGGFLRRRLGPGQIPLVLDLAEHEEALSSCDDFYLTAQPKHNAKHREVKYPEIIILMGCSEAVISEVTSVELEGDIVIVRTKMEIGKMDEFHRHLEEDISGKLLSAMSVTSAGYRLGTVSVNLIDENPSSHAAENLSAKSHFNLMGKALASSVQSTIHPLVEDLSFIYGGKVEMSGSRNGAIDLEVHSTAYLPLPDDLVEHELNGEDEAPSSAKYVSSEDLASWIYEHTHQRRRRSNGFSNPVDWALFVPSQDKARLIVHDEPSGEEGKSTVARTSVRPNGISIVDLTSAIYPILMKETGDYGNVDLDQVYQSYEDRISDSLVYLVGYIRSLHGLPASHDNKNLGLGLSFWEMESIARRLYSTSLESAFRDADALLAVLYQHGGTLAFPEEVAYKLNNATHLLTEAVTLIEQGYPTLYATSLLHGSMQYLESVQSDHQFHELPYFAPDHYLAVFSPLVLPLFLPMMVGLVREVKRYRELQKNKLQSKKI